MNCDTILQNELHEKYLLDRMADEEKKEYLTHLSSCIDCRNELERERKFIYGIRGAGIRQMKDEMRSQAAQAKSASRKYDWTLLFKAAAVLFVIVLLPGTIFYSDLFNSSAPPEEKMVLREIKLYTAEEDASEEYDDNLGAAAESRKTEMKSAAGKEEQSLEKIHAADKQYGMGAGKAAAPKRMQPEARADADEIRTLSAKGAGSKSAASMKLEKAAEPALKESEETLDMLLGAAEGRSESRQAASRSSSKKQVLEIDGLISGIPPQKHKLLNFKDGTRSIAAKFFPPASGIKKYKYRSDIYRARVHLNHPDSVSLTMYLIDTTKSDMLDSLKFGPKDKDVFYLKFPDQSGFEINLQKNEVMILPVQQH